MASNQLNKVIHHLRRALGAPEDAEVSDGQLLQRFADQQDETAFALLLDRYGPMVLGVCRRALGNSHDAEDAFQATFLVLVRKASSLQKADRVGNWLYGVACRIARRARMQAARRGPQAPEVPDMATTEPEPEDWQQVRPLLDEELQRLPRKYRVPLVLCYLEGKTNEAAARHLRWPTGTVKTRLAKGRDLLRDRLVRRGLSLSATAIVAALAPEAVSAAVPPLLASATLKAATAYAAGPAAGAVSAAVLALAERTVHELFRIKLQTIVAVLLVCASLGTGAGWAAYHALAREPLAVQEATASLEPEPPALDDGGLAVSVEQRVRDWQPTRAERRFDEIGWAPDLLTALRLAKQHRRPIFLLAHGGDIATARCPASAFNVRAGILSSDRVIALLNRRYICVHINNKIYAPEGPAHAEEKAELDRIRRQAAWMTSRANGNRVFLLDAAGRPAECWESCLTVNADTLTLLLERLADDPVSDRQGPVVAPAPQSHSPHASADALVLHLTARYLERRGDGLVLLSPKLGLNANFFMKGCPGENWIVLDRAQCAKLLPPADVRPGTRWEIAPDITALLFRNMYPPTEDNDVSRNRIDRQTLQATVVALDSGTVRARLEGRLRMKHRFAPERDDKKFVEAALTGFLDFDAKCSSIRRLQLVSTQATYGKSAFGVAVRSLP